MMVRDPHGAGRVRHTNASETVFPCPIARIVCVVRWLRPHAPPSSHDGSLRRLHGGGLRRGHDQGETGERKAER